MRRSSRSTRGQHSRFSRDDEISLTYPTKEVPQKPSKQEDSKQEDGENYGGEVKCVCNKVYENDEQMMAQCEKCDLWQHVKCLFGEEDESLLPEKYYCHICAPEQYPSFSLSLNPPSIPAVAVTENTLQVLPETETACENDTESNSNNSNPENSPVKVDEANSPPSKKRKVNPVSAIFLTFHILFSNHVMPVGYSANTTLFSRPIQLHR